MPIVQENNPIKLLIRSPLWWIYFLPPLQSLFDYANPNAFQKDSKGTNLSFMFIFLVFAVV